MLRIFAPLKSVRRQLKRINYYSASSGRSVWQRAADWWLFISLPFALATAFLVNAYVQKESATLLMTIRLGKDNLRAPIQSWVEREPTAPWAIGLPLGRGAIFTTRTSAGWPLATTQTDGPTTVKYTDFQGNCTVLEAPLPETWRATEEAIVQALDAERMAPLATAWTNGTTKTSTYTVRYIAQTAIYWVTLFLIGVAALVVLRIVMAWVRIQRHRLVVRRLGRGVCPSCRYDLSGTEFPEYCPECGKRIWG